jgi:hypothetical protein
MYNVTPGRFLGYASLAPLPARARIWLGATVCRFRSADRWRGSSGSSGGGCPRAIQREQKQRLDEIDYQSSSICSSSPSPVSPVGAMQMVGPWARLGQEIQLTLQEQNMGLSIQEAMLNMLARCDTASMRSFVRSIVQGEALGVSIGQIMRDLAHEMRRRRRAIAQEKAQKAPIKILFPLVLLIFPAMFVILLGPAIFTFVQAIGGIARRRSSAPVELARRRACEALEASSC